jgi:hypothetical protein
MLNIEDIEYRLQLYDKAELTKRLWDDYFDDLYKYFYPIKNKFNKTHTTEPEDITEDIFDGTAIVSANHFANFLQQTMIPSYQKWLLFKPGKYYERFFPDKNSSEWKDLISKFQYMTDIFFEYLEQSNFTKIMNESFKDLLMGTGCVLVREGDISDPLFFSNITISDIFIKSNNISDKILDVFRKYSVTLRDIIDLWPNADVKFLFDKQENKNRTFDVLEGVVFNHKAKNLNQRFFYFVTLLDYKKDILTRYLMYNPFVVFRYDRYPGETYGRGLADLCLPFVKILNKMSQLDLKSAQFRVKPVLLDYTGGELTTSIRRIVPGSLIPVDGRGNIRPVLEPLPLSGDVRFTELKIAELREIIRNILYDNPINYPNAKNITATEIAIRQQHFLEQSAATVLRLIDECILPIVKNVLIILSKKGLIDPISLIGEKKEPALMFVTNKQKVKINYVSPLASVQQKKEVANLVEWSNVILQFEQMPSAGFILDTTRLPTWVAEKLNIPFELIKSPEEIERLQQIVQQRVNNETGQGIQNNVDFNPIIDMLRETEKGSVK